MTHKSKRFFLIFFIIIVKYPMADFWRNWYLIVHNKKNKIAKSFFVIYSYNEGKKVHF